MDLNFNLPFLKKSGTSPATSAPINFKRKDLNFFEIQSGVQKSSSSDAVLLLIPIGVICVMAAVYGFNTMRLNSLQAEFTKAENELKSFDLKTKQPILEEYTLTRDILSTYNSWIGALNNQLRYYKTVKPETLDSIINEAGDIVDCNDITLKAGSISFNGSSLSINNISKFSEKCEKIEGLENVFVKSITKETVEKAQSKTGSSYDRYTFVMTADFKSFANETEEEDKENDKNTASTPQPSDSPQT
ncbi:MAG: hypothetical protein J1F64_04310 [Oscillospiraceae bacterium]|nr:hypothetical protein [Oscillospiraceae bacterium]